MTYFKGVAFLCAGMAVGAAGALLFSPRPGSEHRRMMREKFEAGQDLLRDKKDELADAIERRRTGLREAFEAGKQAYFEARQTIHA